MPRSYHGYAVVLASAEACAIDTRSGVFLACVSGSGASTDRFVTLRGAEQATRTLARRSLRAALADIPSALQRAVGRRIEVAAPSAGDPPVGLPYATPR